MRNMNDRALRVATGAIVAAGAWAAPTMAFAEGSGADTGMQLLLPKMAEFIPACIAFLIVWFLAAKFAWPMVLKMMDERENKIRGDLDAAEEAKERAVANQRKIEATVDDARREADEIIAAARRDAERERAQIIATAQENAADIVSKARDAVESERKRAMVELSGSVVDLSVDIASKIIGNGLDDSAQRALAVKYLAEVGSLNE